ncbi:MAG: DUF192 domain-containing protein [Candidatus Pacearchaeota archaeon]|jgi:hypothetical protein
MKKIKLGFNLNNRKIFLDAVKVPWWYKGIGLMFKSKIRAKALLFDFEKKTNISLHSFFVFFDFYALWLDDKNNVLEIQRVKPFQLSVNSKKSFLKVLEIPITKRYFKFLRTYRREFERFK